ncbi:zinc-binding metallopeptidase family protein [Phenylobacterium montanum]|uniref:Zinc-binding peptidase n=1 Tax=Phenylobacterium montanum TaxID=2823693 RepID=A0A975G0H8_9CAUL|nr:putative zinc-binding metallopeptidase [Caulobacter sp. S6]QUD88283.1 putative zinc-binding peptidase [Caulobacter sp. S6]
MKAFACQACGQPLYFEAQLCESCGRRLGYRPWDRTLAALEPCQGRPGFWLCSGQPGPALKLCDNARFDACNWLVDAGEGKAIYCRACRHNRTIPDLSVPGHRDLWTRIQIAQHRLFDSLLALRLPLATRPADPRGLAFDVLHDPLADAPEGPSVLTGHADGLITVSLTEADDPARERRRHDFAEPYRTLLGHFRHESGHYFWSRLVEGGPALGPFRKLFGDERQSYQAALETHYRCDGPPAGWRERFISAYAAVHPWEDFAETWAHYLHMADTLETAAVFGVRFERDGARMDPARLDVWGSASLDQLIAAWLPLTFAVNSLNRSMGQPDLYPFLPEPAVITKLAFVHDLVRTKGALAAVPDETALKAVIAGLAARVGDPQAG